jgi:gamma-glutamylcyclotransferase
METLRYFAYGSNMLPARLLARVPSARFEAVVRLDGYVLSFCKTGGDGSGKCNLLKSVAGGAHAYGVIYRICANEKPVLDKIEGPRYDVVDLDIVIEVARVRAFAYLADEVHMDEQLRPYDWYKAFVLEGAKTHGLPADYVAFLDRVQAGEDLDRDRAASNLAILRG